MNIELDILNSLGGIRQDLGKIYGLMTGYGADIKRINKSLEDHLTHDDKVHAEQDKKITELELQVQEHRTVLRTSVKWIAFIGAGVGVIANLIGSYFHYLITGHSG